MAGNTSLGENYAFAGMYHIFDQHAESGKHGIMIILYFGVSNAIIGMDTQSLLSPLQLFWTAMYSPFNSIS